jgi:hypothetical protein
VDETIQIGIREYPGIFTDAVRCLVIFALDKDRGPLAERWLLGEVLDDAEIDKLQVHSVIDSDDICLAMIKLICENSGKVIMLYFDEIEGPFRMHGAETEQKFLETIKRLYNEIKNVVIVVAVLKEIWPRIQEIMDQALKSRMEQERELKTFSFDDLLLYFAKAMAFFWGQNNLNPPPYPLFPLNDEVLRVIFNKTEGNARSIIKLIRMFIDKILEEDVSLDDLIKESEATEAPVAGGELPEELAPTSNGEREVVSAASASAASKNLMDQIEKMMMDDEYIVEANPASVAGALMKSIKVLAEMFEKAINIEQDFKFNIGKRPYALAGMIESEGKKWGLEIPAIKTFD